VRWLREGGQGYLPRSPDLAARGRALGSGMISSRRAPASARSAGQASGAGRRRI